MAVGAPAALALGLVQPNYWVAGAAWAVLVGALCLADAVLGAPRDRTSLVLEAPGVLHTGAVAPLVLLAVLFLKPLATVLFVRSGAPGGAWNVNKVKYKNGDPIVVTH